MTLGASDTVVGGDLAVRWPGIVPPDGGADASGSAQLTIGGGSHVGTSGCTATNTLYAQSVSLGSLACVGNISATSIANAGATVGSTNAFQATPLPALPLVLPPPATGSDVTVAPSSTLPIAPGNYGNLTLGAGSTASLTTGTYNFRNIVFPSNGGTITTTAPNVTVNALNLTAGAAAVIAPLSGATANKLKVSLSGNLTLGQNARIEAIVAAPHGILDFENGVNATGAFAAFAIVLKDHVVVQYQDGWADAPHGSQRLSGYYGNQRDGAFAVLRPLEQDRPYTLSIGLPTPNPAALANFVSQVSDPSQPLYRQYLTPSSFKAQFGASDSDYAALKNWALSQGFSITKTYSNNLLLTVTGTAAQIEKAFYVNLYYRQGGSVSPGFVATDREPSLDFGPSILWITGFDEYLPAIAQQAMCNPTVAPLGAAGSTTGPILNINGSLFPTLSARDLRQAYLGGGAACQGLTGAPVSSLTLGTVTQTVGVVDLEGVNMGDFPTWRASQPAAGGIAFTGTVTVSTISTPFLPPQNEVALDVELIMSMAPGANIKIFQGAYDFTGHWDDILATMATDPSLTVVSNSWVVGRSPNSQQSLQQFAAQGVSFFDASGDYGDVGDPQNILDMDPQTEVGGTNVTLNGPVNTVPLAGGGSTLVYPQPYLARESTWSRGCPGILNASGPFGLGSSSTKDLSGGGVMNGRAVGNILKCWCFPSDACCGSAPPIPGYQAGVPMSPISSGGNGGSTQYRNYPDVAAVADDFFIVSNGAQFFSSGTSGSAPIWAGFAALVNQQAAINSVGQLGFANPVLYAIGLTRGQPGFADLYSSEFNDVSDNSINQLPQPNDYSLGKPAVAGYDLATGWGTPSCALLQQLASFNPTTN